MPSKKVLSVIILVLALVAAIIVAFGRDKSSKAINYATNLVAGEKVDIPENPNWENELALVPTSTETSQADGASTGEETVTDTVSRSFMANYLALKQSGSLTGESAQKLIDQTINFSEKSGSTAINQITQSQLNVVADNGKQSMFEYGNNLGNILKNNKPAEVKKEYEIVTQALDTKDPSKMNELDGIIVVYDKIANELKKMPVPKTFVKAHLDLVNKLAAMASALRETKAVFSDPLKGLLAVQTYQQNAIVFTKAFQAISTFLEKNGITYVQGTGGYYLLHGI